MKNLPNVVFLPGLLDDQTMWVHQVAGVSGIASPVLLDLVDHSSVEESARWVLDSAPETFSLVGFSMGGYVAFEILRQAPQRVEKLALVSTGARADAEDRLALRHEMISRAEAGDYENLVDEMIPGVLHPDRAYDDALINAIRTMARRIGYKAFVRQLQIILSRPDSRPDLARIQCPTIVIVGNDDVITPPELSTEMADGIDQSKLVLLDNCNHYSPMEQPEKVTASLRDWLSEAC